MMVPLPGTGTYVPFLFPLIHLTLCTVRYTVPSIVVVLGVVRCFYIIISLFYRTRCSLPYVLNVFGNFIIFSGL